MFSLAGSRTVTEGAARGLVVALAGILVAGCVGDRESVVRRLREDDPRTQVATIAQVARSGDRTMAGELIDLLESEDEGVRFMAASALHKLTGKDLGFHFANTPAERARIVAEWRAWWETEGHSPAATQPATRPASAYRAYWLTRRERSEYVDLLISKEAIQQLPAVKFDAAEALPDGTAIVVTTYAKDSIWNVDGRPFKAVESVKIADPDKQEIVLNGRQYGYAAVSLRDVVALLEKPEGTIPIHRTHPPLAGAEGFARELLGRLKGHLEEEESRVPAAHPAMNDEQALSGLVDDLAAKMPKDWAVAPIDKGKVSVWYWAPSEGEGVRINLLPRRLLEVKDRKPSGVFIWLMEPSYTATQPAADEEARQSWPAREIGKWRGRRVLLWGYGGDWPTMQADLFAALKATDTPPQTPSSPPGKEPSGEPPKEKGT